MNDLVLMEESYDVEGEIKMSLMIQDVYKHKSAGHKHRRLFIIQGL